MFTTFREDLRAIQRNDPAAKSALESVFCHTPLHAITLYRIAHWLHSRARLPLIPRLLSVFGHFLTGVEIHPAAKIGRRFFIDHGTGVVIGETSEIGDDCVLFHNVTLGGTGKHRGKRHPTLGDNVLIGTGAILLGPIRIGSNSKIGANSFVRMHDVPPNCTVIGIPARVVKREGVRIDLPLERTELPEASIPVSDELEASAAARAKAGARAE